MTTETDVRVRQLLEGGHKPRNACSLQKLEKVRTDSPLEQPEGKQSCQYLALSSVRPISEK